jgi:predicted phage terminase large subunit-like protein
MRLLEFAQKARPEFTFDWYHVMLLDLLEKCANGDPDVPNLLISLAPGSGKTELVMIIFSAWLIGHNPLREHVVALSSSDVLAKLACSNTMRVLEHPSIAEAFPLSFDKNTETQFTVEGSDGRAAMYSAGIMGQVTGVRATMLLYDDLVRNLETAYSETQLNKIFDNFQAVAQTRLLPTGKIVGIGTRWSLKDPHQKLIDLALANPKARQFVYVNLAAWNTGEDSYILSTKTAEYKYLPKYKAQAKVPDQPYSFSRKQLEGKKADIGPTLWSALYMGNPIASDSQLFPADAWGQYSGVNTDELDLVVSSWDTASKTGSSNDFSANVVLARTCEGRILILDVWKSKVDFSQLPGIVMARWQSVAQRYKTIPALVVEDANSGTQLIQLFQSSQPQIPLIPVKPTKSSVIRAEGVTPLTRAGIVCLPTSAPWIEAFIAECASYPVGQHDDMVCALVHGLKAFLSGGDFRPAQFLLPPGQAEHSYERAKQRAIEDMEYERAIGCVLSDGFKDQGLDW